MDRFSVSEIEVRTCINSIQKSLAASSESLSNDLDDFIDSVVSMLPSVWDSRLYHRKPFVSSNWIAILNSSSCIEQTDRNELYLNCINIYLYTFALYTIS